MPKYTVSMTFEVPGLTAPLDQRYPLRGMASSLHLLAADGLLAVTAAGIRAETAAEASMQVTTEVKHRWARANGVLRVVSWRATPERVLFGRRGRGAGFGPGPTSDGPTSPGPKGDGPDDDGRDDGSAGVREPRRPRPGPGSMSMQADSN